ncbi:MAG TPA: HlyD family efflux transporter periplasmic adaptor subunit [Anaeromyxobacteraceae bacterium]|nr:HlyD family efflux transporter periplasmic adaptor subunit [Anaeromyxobacteraceae bacterium]
MRRLAIGLVALVLVLTALLVVRIRRQAAAESGPAGGSGEIEGIEVSVSARIAARVVAWHAREGEPVAKGALLLTLDCADPEAQLADAEARVAAARAELEAARASAGATRRSQDAAASQSRASRAQAESLAAQRDLARRTAERFEKMADAAAEAARDEATSRAASLAHQASAASAQAAASADQAAAARSSIAAAEARVTAGAAQVAAAEAGRDRARILVDECRVVAPRDAILEDLPHEPGELVPVGGTLATLVDLSDVKAIFYLPNAELAAVHAGAAAEVVADAWPGERFQGRVLTVSTRAEFTPRNIQTRSDRDRLVYPIEVLIPNREGKLRPGMPVQVHLGSGER